jgi:hypothetical protein
MKLVLLGIVALIIVGYTAFTIFRPGQINILAGAKKLETTEAQAIRKAKLAYEEKKKAGENFETSPCLSEDLGEGWAADIVHNPRIVEDDQNKCNSFEQGRAIHLIEMTPDGKIVRAE